MSELLIQEQPIKIPMKLAVRIGLKETIILQEIHYWLLTSNLHKDGKRWVCHTYKEWQSHLPFLSESMIKRAIKSLEGKGLLLSKNYNRLKMDKTKWYTIDYEKLAELEDSSQDSMESTTEQNEMLLESD